MSQELNDLARTLLANGKIASPEALEIIKNKNLLEEVLKLDETIIKKSTLESLEIRREEARKKGKAKETKADEKQKVKEEKAEQKIEKEPEKVEPKTSIEPEERQLENPKEESKQEIKTEEETKRKEVEIRRDGGREICKERQLEKPKEESKQEIKAEEETERKKVEVRRDGKKKISEEKQLERPKEVEVRRDREKKIAEEYDVDFKIHNAEVKHVERKTSDFINYFNSRYELIQGMLMKRVNPISIANVKKTRNDEVSIIGMVYDIKTTASNNKIIELEDPTGKISAMITKNSEGSLFEESENILKDEIIGVRGIFKNNYLFIKELIRPELPITKEVKKLDTPLSCVFISDLHVGSVDFLEDTFKKFLKWLHSKEAENVKYIFVGGDLCVAPGTLILTKKGLKKIEDIETGEEVLTHTNRWQKVKKVFKRKVDEDIYGISTDNSTVPDILLTRNHPVWTTIRKNRYFSTRGLPSWTRASELSKEHSIFNIRTEEQFSPVKEVKFSKIPKKDRIRNSKLPERIKVDEDFLTVIGLFLGDGSLKLNEKRGTVYFYFEKKKKNDLPSKIVKRWAKRLNLNLLVYNWDNLEVLYINSKPLAKFFSQFYKNKEKHIPESWLNTPLEQFKWIIYGLILSDGCFEKRKIGGRVRLSNTNINLLKKIKLRLEFSGIYTSLCLSRGESSQNLKGKRSLTKKYYELSLSNETVIPILKLFGFTEGLRKNPRDFRESFFYSVKKVRENKKQKYKGYVYNLEVENGNSYIANGIILHNCDGIGIYLNQEKDLSIKSGKKQYEYAAELLKKVPEHIKIIVQPGNHDIVGNHEPQNTLRETALSQLPNIIFGTNPCWVSLDKIKILMYHGYSYDNLIRDLPLIRHKGYREPTLPMIEVLKRRHLAPSYGSSLVMPEQKDYLVIEDIPDIFQSGHLHTVGVDNYKNVLVINSGTFQGRTKYQEMLGHMPHPGIFVKVDLDTRKSRMVNLENY